MIHPRPDRTQALGLLEWEVDVDLTRDDAGPIIDLFSLLSESSMRGRTIRLIVADKRPRDLDYRIVPVLQEVRAAGVGIRVCGDLYAVGTWVRAIRGDDAVLRAALDVVR